MEEKEKKVLYEDNCGTEESTLRDEKTDGEESSAPDTETSDGNKAKPKLTPKETFIQVIKFVLFSCGAGIIQLGAFTLMNEIIRWNYWVSYLIALVLSVLYNFTVNRRYTFKSANNVPLAMALVFLFYAAFTPYSVWLTDYLTMDKGLNEYLVLFICMAQNLTLEFLWCRFVVYAKSINTNKLAKKGKKEENTEDNASENNASEGNRPEIVAETDKEEKEGEENIKE